MRARPLIPLFVGVAHDALAEVDKRDAHFLFNEGTQLHGQVFARGQVIDASIDVGARVATVETMALDASVQRWAIP